jgi:mRNA interferase MazF
VVLEFPYSSQEEGKRRPALVVSSDKYNRGRDDCVVAAITSVLKDDPFSVSITSSDLEEGAIMKDSKVRADKLWTVEQAMIGFSAGRLNQAKFDEVKRKIFALF